MATIHIKDLLLRTYIGFNTEEKNNKQDVVINVTLHVNANRAIESDRVDGSYDYKKITKKIISFVQDGRFNMLENLTQQILDMVMKDNRVKFARVEVDKPHALRFARSVSVELEASRNE